MVEEIWSADALIQVGAILASRRWLCMPLLHQVLLQQVLDNNYTTPQKMPQRPEVITPPRVSVCKKRPKVFFVAYGVKETNTYISGGVVEEGGHAVERHGPDLCLVDGASILSEVTRKAEAIRGCRADISKS